MSEIVKNDDDKLEYLKSIGLDVGINEVNRDWVDQKFIMLGQSKIGKTTFWAQGENTFFIKTEAGHNHVKHMGIECRDYQEFDSVLNKLIVAAKQPNKFPFDTVVIDTGDRLLNFIEDECVERGIEKYPNSEINSIGDIPNGSGWYWRTNLINHTLVRLESLPAAVTLIFHVATEEREDAVGRKYKVDTINVGGKSGKALLGWADHILHMKSLVLGERITRKMLLKGTKNVEAGSRLSDIPSEFTWGENAKENYNNFRKLFN